MALQSEEEETLEAIKKWWDENGKQLITMALVVSVAFGGWYFWQNSLTTTSAAASDRYEEILNLAIAAPGEAISAEDSARIRSLADELKAEFSGSVYALYGALFAAQQAVQAEDLALAEEELRWLLANTQDGFFSKTDESLILTASLRLGRVLLASGEAQQALDLVNSVDPQSFEPDYAELRGDILMALDRPADARDAYMAAQQSGSVSNFLQMKLDDLNVET